MGDRAVPLRSRGSRAVTGHAVDARAGPRRVGVGCSRTGLADDGRVVPWRAVDGVFVLGRASDAVSGLRRVGDDSARPGRAAGHCNGRGNGGATGSCLEAPRPAPYFWPTHLPPEAGIAAVKMMPRVFYGWYGEGDREYLKSARQSHCRLRPPNILPPVPAAASATHEPSALAATSCLPAVLAGRPPPALAAASSGVYTSASPATSAGRQPTCPLPHPPPAARLSPRWQPPPASTPRPPWPQTSAACTPPPALRPQPACQRKRTQIWFLGQVFHFRKDSISRAYLSLLNMCGRAHLKMFDLTTL